MIFRYGSKYGIKDIPIFQYSTKQEKDILVMLMQTINHVHFNTLDEAMEIIGYLPNQIAPLSDAEKRIILLKCRELSVGDDISFNFHCKKCNNLSNTIAKVDNFFTNRADDESEPMRFKDFMIQESFIDMDGDNLTNYIRNFNGSEIDEEFLDNMDTIQYEDIFDEVKNNTLKFQKDIFGFCSTCGNKVPIHLGDNFIVENMSEDSISSMYKTYSDLIYFGNYTKQDIDSLVPFERTIFVGMLNSTRKETAK